MAMGGNVTHCEKRMTRQVRILFTTPRYWRYGAVGEARQTVNLFS